MPNILVAGGAGFLGRHLCKKLLECEDNMVICIDNLITGSRDNIAEFQDNPRFKFLKHDITKLKHKIYFDFLPHIDEIYNLACIASPDKYKVFAIETLETCFIGTKNLLDIAVHYNAKLLQASTSEVYGDPSVHPQPESYYGNVNTVGERSCYDEGKRVAETLVYEYRKKKGIDAKIIRIFNTYGPYMDIDDGRVITNFIKQIIKKQALRIYGNGMQTRSFCYVDDLIKGIVAMMGSCEYGPMNLGNPYCEFTLLELVSVFEQYIGYELNIDFLDSTENDPQQRKPDITKARDCLGFEPCVLLYDGIQKTMEYFQMHFRK